MHNGCDAEMRANWEKEAASVASNIGDRMSGTGLLLANYCKVILVEGDFRYDTVPRIKDVDDVIELTCNVDAFDQWKGMLSSAPDVDDKEIQHLYLGVGIAQAELSLVANQSLKETSKLNGRQRMSIGKRAIQVLSIFESRQGLSRYARKFEEQHELWGLEDMVSHQLKPQQILRINQIRYGLAVSMFAMDLEPETEMGITEAFVEELKNDILQRDESLYGFLQSFAGDNFEEVTKRQEKIHAYSFPELLFAGTMPMNIFEVIE